MSKKSLDSTDISDDFSPGSIIPQRPQGPKTPMQSPHYASNRRRHTRMSRRHSPVADETVIIGAKKKRVKEKEAGYGSRNKLQRKTAII